jgi:hypothetical protein
MTDFGKSKKILSKKWDTDFGKNQYSWWIKYGGR